MASHTAGGGPALKGRLASVSSYVGSGWGVPGAVYTSGYGYDSRYRTVRIDQMVPARSGVAGTGPPMPA